MDIMNPHKQSVGQLLNKLPRFCFIFIDFIAHSQMRFHETAVVSSPLLSVDGKGETLLIFIILFTRVIIAKQYLYVVTISVFPVGYALLV